MILSIFFSGSFKAYFFNLKGKLIFARNELYYAEGDFNICFINGGMCVNTCTNCKHW